MPVGTQTKAVNFVVGASFHVYVSAQSNEFCNIRRAKVFVNFLTATSGLNDVEF